MTTYFVADTHFGHRNIIRYDRRPWETIEEMDAALIANWRRTVRDEDTVYHIGDVSMWGDQTSPLGYLLQLTGQIRIIPGNHDAWLVAAAEQVKEATDGRVQVMAPLLEVKGVAIATLWLCHYALETWDRRHKTIHLHGHTHPGHDPFDPCPGLRERSRRYNICMGSLFHGAPPRQWRPLTVSEIIKIYSARAERAAREVEP